MAKSRKLTDNILDNVSAMSSTLSEMRWEQLKREGNMTDTMEHYDIFEVLEAIAEHNERKKTHYVDDLIELLSDEGYEFEIKSKVDQSNGLIYVYYETDEGERIMVQVICSDEMFILRTKGEEAYKYILYGVERINELNRAFADYRFVLRPKGYSVIEIGRSVGTYPDCTMAEFILDEIEAISQVRNKMFDF